MNFQELNQLTVAVWNLFTILQLGDGMFQSKYFELWLFSNRLLKIIEVDAPDFGVLSWYLWEANATRRRESVMKYLNDLSVINCVAIGLAAIKQEQFRANNENISVRSVLNNYD